jgi:hypothetical protein
MALKNSSDEFRAKDDAFINVCKQRYHRRESELGSIAVLVVKKLTFATYNKGLM